MDPSGRRLAKRNLETNILNGVNHMFVGSVFAAAARKAFAFGRLGSTLAGAATCSLVVLLSCAAALADTYYVDGASPAASDAGPGSDLVPYRTIQAAVTARGTAGNTILVRPATYREAVTIPQSGTTANRIALVASPAGAVIAGTDDFSGTARWSHVAGDVYLASGVTWAPLQVFLDGTRLVAATAAPASIPSGSFVYVAGTGLYVNAGGDNPGLHALEVGRRLQGVSILGAYVTLDGFHVTRTEDKAVYVRGGGALVQNNRVDFANKFGIHVSRSVGSTVLRNVVGDNADHGIHVSDTSSFAQVRLNDSARNWKPGVRSAAGINFHQSPNGIAEGNRCHDNQDTGLQFYNGSNYGYSIHNLSWNNGDHGYDHLQVTGIVHFNDLAYGNYKDGFSIEGSSPGCSMFNCIAVDNGLTSTEYNLWVDEPSFVGFVSDHNLFWNSTSRPPVKIGSSIYSAVSAYAAARGQDSNSRQSDPRFILPASGDFRLMSDSPAIDAAAAGAPQWPATDIDGGARYDDPSTTDTGSGTPAYADLGVYEYRPVGVAPDASLSLTPVSGVAPLAITADASLSNDPDGTIVAYRFDFGDGTRIGPQTSPIATHTLAAGTWSVKVTVVDDHGRIAEATVPCTVANPNRPPVLVAPATATVVEGQVLQFTVTASDPDGDPIDSLLVDPSALPGDPGSFTVNGSRTSGTFRWTPAEGNARATPYVVSFRARNDLQATVLTAITVVTPNVLPSATVTATPRSGSTPLSVAFDASGSSDPDGSILYYRFTFGDGTFAGPQASPTATHVYSAGNWVAQVTVTDNRGGVVTSVPVDIQSLGQSGNRASNPGFETNLSGWVATGPDTLFRVGGGRTGGFALEMRSAASNGSAMFGANDSPDIIPNAGPIGSHYHFEAWVRSESHRGNAKLRIREYNGGVLQGAAVFSPAVALSGTWQRIALDYTAQSAYGSIDFNVLDAPVAAGEVFQVDDVMVQATALSLPVVVAPASVSFPENTPISITLTANDPDGDPIQSLGASLAALPLGSDATFTTNAAKTEGTLTWTPSFQDANASPYPVTFIASNTGTGTATTSILITNSDRAPVPVAPDTVVVVETLPVSIAVTASDADGEAFTISADLAGLPAGHGAVFTPGPAGASGTLTWTPRPSDGPGTYPVVFVAGNAAIGRDTTFVVVRNHGPVVASPAIVDGAEGQPLSFGITAQEPDGIAIVALTAGLAVLPAGHGASFVPNGTRTTGTFHWTPRYTDSGSYAVVFSATNPDGLTGRDTTLVRIQQVDRAPVVTAPDTATVTETQRLTLTISAADPDGQSITSLTANLSGLPAAHDAVFTANAQKTGGTLTWTPSYVHAPGPYFVTFVATNALTASKVSRISVSNVDRAPLLSVPENREVPENEIVSLEIAASDPDAEPIASLTADLSSLPAGHNAVFTPNPSRTGGTFTWTPGAMDRGPYPVKFLASNALSARDTVRLTVDHYPRVTMTPSLTTPENQRLVMNLTAFDPDGQPVSGLQMREVVREPSNRTHLSTVEPDGTVVLTLVADLSNLPAGNNAVISTAAAKIAGTQAWTLSWTPTYDDARLAPYPVTFTVRNSLSTLASSAITVRNVNRAPVVTVPPTIVAPKGAPLTVVVAAADPDGDPITSLTADLSALPAHHTAEFTPHPSNNGGTLTWTPLPGDPTGPYAITFTAQNELEHVSTSSITLTRTPVVVVSPIVAGSENQPVTVTVVASDPDGDPITSLTADLSGLPAGHNAVFTANPTKTSGTLTWTPGYTHGRVPPYRVTFTASNAGSGSSGTTITIANLDRAPVVTAPATVNAVEGVRVTLTVSASDPDGEPITALTANLGGLPPGHDAVFTPNASRTSGTLTWTPTSSDGRASPPYGITFTATNAASGSAATAVTVSDTPSGGLCGNPGFESSLTGWAKHGSGTVTLSRVSPGRSGTYCAEVRSTASGTFGINDSPAWVPTVPVAGTTYRVTAWVRSAAHRGDAKIKVREYLGGTQQGSSAYSSAVVLSPTWQKITFDYVTRAANSSLDIQINNYPAASGEVFQIDDISIVRLPGAIAITAEIEQRPDLGFAASMSNPVRSAGTLNLTTTRAGAVRFEILDVTGRRVGEPVNEFLPAGRHTWSIRTRDGGTRLAAGAYFYRLHAAEGVKSGRFIVLE